MSTYEHRLRSEPDEGLAWLVRHDAQLRHRDGSPRVARVALEAGIHPPTLHRTTTGELPPSGRLIARLVALAMRTTGATRGSAYTHLFDVVDDVDSKSAKAAA